MFDLFDLIFFVAGATLRWVWPRIKVIQLETVKTIAAPIAHCHVSPGRKRIAFQHQDGTVDVKTLFIHSITDPIHWAGKQFSLTDCRDGVDMFTESVEAS